MDSGPEFFYSIFENRHAHGPADITRKGNDLTIKILIPEADVIFHRQASALTGVGFSVQAKAGEKFTNGSLSTDTVQKGDAWVEIKGNVDDYEVYNSTLLELKAEYEDGIA